MKKNVLIVDPEGKVSGPDFMANVELHDVDMDMEGERNNLLAEDGIQAVEIPLDGSSVVAVYEDGTVRITTYVE